MLSQFAHSGKKNPTMPVIFLIFFPLPVHPHGRGEYVPTIYFKELRNQSTQFASARQPIFVSL
jgi:hypothetical protein